jgi:glycerate kinase
MDQMTSGPQVLVVASAFKESLGAPEVAAMCRQGVAAAGARAVVMLGSDGGDGLLDALETHVIRTTTHEVRGPLGKPAHPVVGWLDDATAVIESRLVCGLGLVPPARRDPERTSTEGLGELLALVAAEGGRQAYVGLGGSATMDGGMGMARAWGAVPRDAGGDPLAPGGGSLERLATLEPGTPPALEVTGLVDVRNRLWGPDGARVYASQKGATAESAGRLDRGLRRLAQVLGEPGRDWADREGAGAAGGLGFGILAFAGGRLERGAPWLLDRAGFDALLDGADAVLTGEGGFDATSLSGKLTGEVIRRARYAGKSVGLLAPSAAGVPEGVVVESGGGQWDAVELARRTTVLVRRLVRLPPA